MDEKESCNNCVYERYQTCRRYPPVLTITQIPRDGTNPPTTDTITQWPTVASYPGGDAWCGEWKHPSELIKVVLDNGS